LSQLVNICRNKGTLSCQLLTNSNISNSIDLTQDSCYFGNYDSILAYPFKLDQTSNFENLIDILASYPKQMATATGNMAGHVANVRETGAMASTIFLAEVTVDDRVWVGRRVLNTLQRDFHRNQHTL